MRKQPNPSAESRLSGLLQPGDQPLAVPVVDELSTEWNEVTRILIAPAEWSRNSVQGIKLLEQNKRLSY